MVIYVLLLHYIGDFLLQHRKMAENKSESNWWLSLHVLAYAITLFAGLVFFYDLKMTLFFVLVNAALHFVTDRITSLWTKHFFLKKNNYGFFGIIGFDQFIHSATLIITYDFIFNSVR